MALTTYTAGEILTAASLNSNLSFAAQSGGLVSVAPTSVGKTGASSTATASTNGQVTFSLCESLTLNGVFTSDYANYRIIFSGFSSTNATLWWRLSVGGTANSSSSYNRQYVVASGATVSGTRVTLAAQWSLMENINTTDADNFSMDIFSPQLLTGTSFNLFGHSTVANSYWQTAAGYFISNTQFDGIQLLFSTAGTFSGRVSVYGYNQ